ncbi:MAG: sensor histidine kinase [Chromatiales bacterium]|nr:sensor histidine kinase [Chromatiales bacterium]
MGKTDVVQSVNGEVGIDASTFKMTLLPSARTIKDVDSKLTLDQILKQPAEPSDYKRDKTASFGFSSVTYWFLVTLNNQEQTPLQRLLVFDPTWLDDVQVNLILPDGGIQTFKGGDQLPFNYRAVSHRKTNFELTLPSGRSQLLVRTHTRDPYVVNMTLWERSAFFESDVTEANYYGFLYGVLGGMLLYNLILFISIRESIYAVYVIYVFSFIIGNATYNGHTYPLLWPDSPIWSNWAHSTFIYLYLFTGLFFTIRFLDLRNKLPHAYRLAKSVVVLMFIFFVLTAILGGYQWHVASSILWVVVYSPFVLWMGLLSWRSGNRAALYFLIATTAGLIGSAITALTVSSAIPFSFYTFHATDFGMMLDTVLLSFALADRLRIARAETEEVKTELLESIIAHTEKLENRVIQRTSELRESNTTKDKFFSIIAHDLRGPIGSLATLFNDIVLTAKDFNDETLKAVRVTTQNTSNFLEQLLTWARSQRGEISYTPEAIELSEVLAEIQELFFTQAQAKGVKLNLIIDRPYWVVADVAMVNTILRNLTSNALKFTEKDDVVHASVQDAGNQYLINITDSGIGMSEELQQELFLMGAKPQSKLGTNNESGTGLGLVLCSEFVAKNHGKIGVKSEEGVGTTFWFTLPKG